MNSGGMGFFKRNWWKLLITLFVTFAIVPFWPPLYTECVARESNLPIPSLLNPASLFMCSVPAYIFMIGWRVAIFFEPRDFFFSKLFFGVEGLLFRYFAVFLSIFIGIYLLLFFLRHGSNELDSLPTKQPKPGSAANQPKTQTNRPPREGDSPRLPANRGWLGSSHCA